MTIYSRYWSMLIFSILKFIVCGTTTYTLHPASAGRIVGGSSISITEAKFVVSIRSYGFFICGGSLVTPRHVVTAAHCVADKMLLSLTVTGGTAYLSERGVRRNVQRITMPNNFNRPDYNMDLAVLELSANMTGDKIAPIDLCNVTIRNHVHVYGWGNTLYTNPSNRLRTVTVPILSRRECIDIYKEYIRITPTMFCAGDLKGKDACYGDSGGAAVYSNQLCGVVSWGPECASDIFPGVYTNIKVLRSFIEKAIRK